MTVEPMPEAPVEEQTPITMKAAAKIIYASITAKVIDEAARLDSVDAEVALLRLWLAQSIAQDSPNSKDIAFMRALFSQIVRAVAVKYRLSPKRTDDFATAMRSILNGIGEQIDEDYVEV